MESKGYPKTAALFQRHLRDGVFTHPDAGIEAELNALRCDISGSFIFQAQFLKDRRDQVLVVHKR